MFKNIDVFAYFKRWINGVPQSYHSVIKYSLATVSFEQTNIQFLQVSTNTITYVNAFNKLQRKVLWGTTDHTFKGQGSTKIIQMARDRKPFQLL